MTDEAGFFLALKVVSGITCILSILGASLIIATYVAFRDLRTVARQQLVNLSLADMIVAASHFVGLAALQVENYETPHSGAQDHNGNASNYSITTEQDVLCRVQGGFTMLGTLASFLWTLALGFYMLMVIVLKRTDVARSLIFLYYPFCWGVPLVLTLWFGFVKPTYLGFGEGADIGWCYIRVVPDSKGAIDHSTTVLAEVLGYELWFYATFVSLAAIYITMLCYIKYKGMKVRVRKHIGRYTDLKLVLVPLIFILLRMWSGIIDIVHYATLGEDSPRDDTGGFFVLVLLAGIGDSAQGLANAVLFCAFTRQVRNKLLDTAHAHLCCCCCPESYLRLRNNEEFHDLEVREATTQLDGDSLREETVRQQADSSWETSLIVDHIPGKYGTSS